MNDRTDLRNYKFIISTSTSICRNCKFWDFIADDTGSCENPEAQKLSNGIDLKPTEFLPKGDFGCVKFSPIGAR